MNPRPPGYEPDELPAALPRDDLIMISHAIIFVNPLFLLFLSKKPKLKNMPLAHGSIPVYNGVVSMKRTDRTWANWIS